MIKRLLITVALFSALSAAQTVQPIVVPHQTFVDGNGSPCAGCFLYSYAAGTTTPLATYTDSTGGTPNTNPVTLDAAGGGTVWLTSGTAYKFVLQSASSSTLWTVDNVVGGLYLSNTYLPLAGGTLTGPLIGTTANFSGGVTSGGFTGSGANLTGTATGLSIGGNAATATNAGHASNLPGDFQTQSNVTRASGTFLTVLATDLEGPIGTNTPAAGTFTTIRATVSAALVMPTGNINANTCTSPTVQAFSGVTATSQFTMGYATTPVGVTGWGSTGGLVLALWPDLTPANGFDWAVCNQTTSTINAGAITINVGVI